MGVLIITKALQCWIYIGASDFLKKPALGPKIHELRAMCLVSPKDMDAIYEL